MATQENIEYLALLKCTVELTSEISAHPLSVSSALVARGLIPEPVHRSILIPTKEDSVKASELVSQVTNKIKIFPARFSDFLEVLQSYNWLKDVLEILTAVYDKLKAENSKASTDTATTSTEGISKSIE